MLMSNYLKKMYIIMIHVHRIPDVLLFVSFTMKRCIITTKVAESGDLAIDL